MAAGKIWQQHRIISAWCSTERAHQHGDKVSELINNRSTENGTAESQRVGMLDTQAIKKDKSRTAPGSRLHQLAQNCKVSTQHIFRPRPGPTSSSSPTTQHYRPILLRAEQGVTRQHRALSSTKGLEHMKYGKSDEVLGKRHGQYKKKARSKSQKGIKAAQTSQTYAQASNHKAEYGTCSQIRGVTSRQCKPGATSSRGSRLRH